MDKARIVTVGLAGYADGLPFLSQWHIEDGPFGFNPLALNPDTPCLGGWTFRELHAIANGVGPHVPAVLPFKDLPLIPESTLAS